MRLDARRICPDCGKRCREFNANMRCKSKDRAKPFRFAYGERSVRIPDARRAILESEGAIGRAPRGKCSPGATITSLVSLWRYLESEPSVWVSFANKPLPCTVVLNWQMRQVVNLWRSRCFWKVIRPKPRRALPIITDRDFA